MRVVLRSPLSPHTGYGNDGLGLCEALVNAGHAVMLVPSAVEVPLPEVVAATLMNPVTVPFDLHLSHIDPGQMESNEMRRRNGRCLIGWTMWEQTTFDNLGTRKAKVKLRRRLRYLDAIACYDAVTKEAFTELGVVRWDGEPMPLVIQQGGFRPEDWPLVDREPFPDRPFRFCMVGQLHERKDPFVAIAAYRRMLEMVPEGSIELHLKTTVPGLSKAMEEVYPGLKVYYESWTTEKLRSFYSQMDVLLAPSRGEGKNMPALEFQSTGGVVAATNWGGHTGWLHPAYAYPVSYELRPVDPRWPNCLQARASEDSLLGAMMSAFHARGPELIAKGRGASSMVAQTHSWDAVTQKLLDTLQREGIGGPWL